MKNNDYGFYGKGTSGYVHYKQAFDESQKNSGSGNASKRDKTSLDSGKKSLTDPILTAIGGIIFVVFIVAFFSYMSSY